MKKFCFKILMSLICVITFIGASGCACSKNIDVYYHAKITNESGENVKKKLEVKVETGIKYRENMNTPCYKKVDDRLELIEDARNVCDCYDKDGNYFEKATFTKAEYEKLDETYIMNNEYYDRGISVESISKKTKLPKKGTYSLYYTITLHNYDARYQTGNLQEYYIKALTKEEILGGLLTEKGLEKIEFTAPQVEATFDGQSYYFLEKQESVVIKIGLKNLTKEDFELTKMKELKLNFDIVIRD